MKQYVICRACGYIMDASKLGERCPACGMPKTAFEPYTKKLSPQRRMVLDQHLHPILTHFPQVLVIAALVALALALVVQTSWRDEILIVAKYSILLLPFFALIGMITGMIDGKCRFKKLKTPLLIRKIKAALLFLALSLAIFVLYLSNGFTTSNMVALLILSILATGCCIFLGKKGSGMVGCFLPG